MRRQAKILGKMAAAVCGALLLDAGLAAAAEFRLQPSVSVQRSISDNIDQEPDGQETAAFTTDVSPRADLRWTGRRVSTALNLALTASHQTDGEDEGVNVNPDVAGLANAEIWREHLFLDASASASSELLNTRDRDTESNRAIVQNYSVNPRLVGRIGSFANLETNYGFDQVIETGGSASGDSASGDSESGVGNSQTHSLGASVSSGPDFTKWSWSLDALASESDRDDGDSVSRRDASLDLTYAIDRSFTLLGSVGVQSFDDGDSENEFEEPTWDVGFRWRPGPRTDLTATYGQSDGEESFAADIRYQITPRTGLFASYDEILTTGEERLITDLSSIGTDPETGDLIDTNTGLPFEPSRSTTTLDNDTQRTKILSFGLNGIRGRNSFGMNGSVEFTKDEGGGGEDEDAYNLNLSGGRQLSPLSSIRANASYSRNEFKIDGRVDDEYSIDVQYSYSIFSNVSAFSSYDFTRQDSTNKFDEFIENRITLGVSVTF